MKNEATEGTLAAVAQKFTVGGGSVAMFGGLTANEIAAFGGLLVAVVGLCVQFYYKRRQDKRDHALHLARMERLGEDEYGADGL
jgi:fermentation-respiration switch protein FrsA (DUF1100 family)